MDCISVGIACVIPFIRFTRIIAPSLIMDGRFCVIVDVIVVISCGRIAASCGIVWFSPCSMPVNSVTAAFNTSGSSCGSISIAVWINVKKLFVNGSISDCPSPFASPASSFAAPDNPVISCGTACRIRGTAAMTRGAMLSITVTTESTNSPTNASRSAFSSASPVCRFVHAAFAEAIDP